MKKKYLFLTSFIIAALSLFLSVSAQASEFNFAVDPIIPENQLDKKLTYFDLKMDKGTQQTLNVQLRNDTDKDITVEASINSATTNLNGVVEYSANKIKPDESLKYNLKDYAKIDGNITLAKHTEKEVPISVTMPKEAFDGVMAGGITFKEKNDDSKADSADKDKGLSIKNEYSYVVALLLRQNTTDVQPDLKLKTVEPDQVNARNVINIGLQNPKSAYLNQLNIDAAIYEKGSTEVLYKSQKDGMQMAPNSHFSYPISLNGEKLKAGKYVMKMTAYGMKDEKGSFKAKDSNGKEASYIYRWNFEKEFEIKSDVADKLNEKDVSIEKNNNWIYWLIGILILLLLLLILWFYLRKRKKDNEENEDKDKNDA